MEPTYLKCKRRCFICEEKGRKGCKKQARKKAPLTMTNTSSSFQKKILSFFLLFLSLCCHWKHNNLNNKQELQKKGRNLIVVHYTLHIAKDVNTMMLCGNHMKCNNNYKWGSKRKWGKGDWDNEAPLSSTIEAF
jgi:hypothetical protein